MTDLVKIRAHDFACLTCGAAPGQWCDLGGVRVWAVVHDSRAEEAVFADALDTERRIQKQREKDSK